MWNIFEMDKLRDIRSAVRLNKCGKTFKNNALQACQDKTLQLVDYISKKGFTIAVVVSFICEMFCQKEIVYF